MNLRSLFLSVALLLLPRHGLAQSTPKTPESSAPAAEVARQRGHEGLQQFSAGRFHEALDAFDAAESLTHSPVFVLYRARALRELGQFLAARDAYEQCAEEALTESAPAAWVRAVADARREMRQLRLLIPALHLRIEGQPSWPVEITWQGRHVTLSEPGSGGHAEAILEGDPGLWEIHLQAQDGTEIHLHFAARVARRSDVLAPYFPVKTALPQREKASPSERPVPEPRLSARTWGAIAAFSCGGVSLVAGSISGGMALARAHAVRDGCVGSSCLPEDEERADSARRLANLATAGFVVSAVGATAGLGLLFIPGRGTTDSRSAQSLRGIQLSATISGIDLTGRF